MTESSFFEKDLTNDARMLENVFVNDSRKMILSQQSSD
jgi:hypothetical protein